MTSNLFSFSYGCYDTLGIVLKQIVQFYSLTLLHLKNNEIKEYTR